MKELRSGVSRPTQKDNFLSSQRELDLSDKAKALGIIIENKLGVEYASLVCPEDLIMSAHAAYLGDGNHIIIPDIEPFIMNTVALVPEEFLIGKNLKREELAEIYPKLIGNGNYGNGEIAAALRRAKATLPTDDEAIKKEFARLMANRIIEDPDIAGNSNVTLSSDGEQILFRGSPLHSFSMSPGFVVEYGPGVSAARRIPSELASNPKRKRTVYIEKGQYLEQLLSSIADFYGVGSPRVVAKRDGISSASRELLATGAEHRVDLVTASMVHAAGLEELSEGIENAKRLLRRGGVLAIQAAHNVKNGEAEGLDVLKKAVGVFGRPLASRNDAYLQFSTKSRRLITQAIFIA